MPRIKMDAKQWTNEFNAMRQQAIAMGETNDCTVKAITLVTGAEYKTVHELLAAEGRKPRRGAYKEQQWAVLDKLGFKVTQVMMSEFIRRYPGAHKNLGRVTTHHMHRFNKVWADGHKYLVYTPSHVAAVINGINHDWTRGRAVRCTSLYRIERKEVA